MSARSLSIATTLLAGIGCATTPPHAPSIRDESPSVPDAPSRPSLELRPKPQVVQQISVGLRSNTQRSRTADRDWEVGWSNDYEYDASILVREAATGLVLYRVTLDIMPVSVALDAEHAVLCAIVDTDGAHGGALDAVGWDLGGAREMWRHALSDDVASGPYPLYRAAVLDDQCVLTGKAQEVALRLADGEPEPRTELPLERASDAPAVGRGVELDADMPASTWMTRGRIWYQNRAGLWRQDLDALALPARVTELVPPANTWCDAADADHVYCAGAQQLTLLAPDGTTRTTKLPKPCKDGVDGAAITGDTLAVRCGATVLVGEIGHTLHEVKKLKLSALGHRALFGSAGGFAIADAAHGVSGLDTGGRVRWHVDGVVSKAGRAPGDRIYVERARPSSAGDEWVLGFLDLETGAPRGEVVLLGPFGYRLAIVDDALFGRTYFGDRIVVRFDGDTPAVTTLPGPGGLLMHADAQLDTGVVVSTSPGYGTAQITSTDGEVLLHTQIVRDGAFAIAGDGRFLCRGEGCDALRCTVDGESRPIDDAACADLRMAP